MKKSARFRAQVLERDGRCLACGVYLDERTVNPHHITTKGAGGDDSPENGIALCQTCHVAVHNGHITPSTLRWILKLTYGYEYELPDGDEDRHHAQELMAAYTVKTGGIW